MRLAVGVMLCLNAGALPLALADPPAASPTAPPAAAVSSPPAATAPAAVASAAATAAPTDEVSEKHFLAEGYKLEMHDGQKLFCRKEELLGSRLGGRKVCSTLEHLKSTETDTRETVEKVQRTMHNPNGK